MSGGKVRPALLLAQLPGLHDDWLTCMISSQRKHFNRGFDEIVEQSDSDFVPSGLKLSSVIRIGRLAVVEGNVLLGAVGEISDERLKRIKTRLAQWLSL